MDLVLTGVNVQRVVGKKWRDQDALEDWCIRDADEKLRAKYSHGRTAIFDHYVFNYEGARSNVVSSVDVEAADRLMGAQVGRKTTRRDAVMKAVSLPEFRRRLGRIPWDASIIDRRHDADVRALFEILIGHDVRLAIASKILTIKRPFLIPMMDSVVQVCFARRGLDEAIPVMEGFRRLLGDLATAATVRKLAGFVEKRFGIAVSPVRVVDQLIWFDWNLVRRSPRRYTVSGYTDWWYDPARHERGIVRR